MMKSVRIAKIKRVMMEKASTTKARMTKASTTKVRMAKRVVMRRPNLLSKRTHLQ